MPAPIGCRCATRRRSRIFIEPGKHVDTHPQEMVGARRALPDGGVGRAGAGARRGGGGDAAGERLRVRRRRRAHRAADQAGQGPRHRRAVPERCELVYEGFMPSPEELTMNEGPFGEWPGYYTSIGPGAGAAGQGDLSPQRSDPVRDAAGAADLSRHLFRHRRLGAHPRRLAVGRSRGRGRARHQGRLEDAGRRLALHQRDRDRAAARRPRQDGGPGRRRLRLEHLSRPHHHHRRRRHRHHQSGAR